MVFELVSTHKRSGPATASGYIPAAEDIYTRLYNINVLEMCPNSDTEYALKESRKATYARQRVNLESQLIAEVKKTQSSCTIDSTLMDPEALLTKIQAYTDKMLDQGYVDWFENHATLKDARTFVKEYGADQVYFTLYLSLLSAIAPEQAAVEIYSNLYDETGLNSKEQTADRNSLYHPEVFRRLQRYFSVNPVDRFHRDQDFTPQTLRCISMILLSIRMGYLQGAGAIFLMEASIPRQLEKINNGLKRLGVPAYEREFIEMHCKLDSIHSQNWWTYGIRPYLKTQKDVSDLIFGIHMGLSARNIFWAGLINTRK